MLDEKYWLPKGVTFDSLKFYAEKNNTALPRLYDLLVAIPLARVSAKFLLKIFDKKCLYLTFFEILKVSLVHNGRELSFGGRTMRDFS